MNFTKPYKHELRNSVTNFGIRVSREGQLTVSLILENMDLHELPSLTHQNAFNFGMRQVASRYPNHAYSKWGQKCPTFCQVNLKGVESGKEVKE